MGFLYKGRIGVIWWLYRGYIHIYIYIYREGLGLEDNGTSNRKTAGKLNRHRDYRVSITGFRHITALLPLYGIHRVHIRLISLSCKVYDCSMAGVWKGMEEQVQINMEKKWTP